MTQVSQDPRIIKKHSQILEDWEKKDFIERVPDEKDSESAQYTPDHGMKKESSTTPVRIVYDCSFRQSPHDPSLNECLASTPPDLNDFSGILLRFRLNNFAISTDIEKAFLHMTLDMKDFGFTRFFRQSDPTDPRSQPAAVSSRDYKLGMLDSSWS